MYGIDGRAELPEFEHESWEGYRGSHPVRIGNAAAEQRQLDIYGELIDSVYLFNKYGSPIFAETWDNVRRIVDCRARTGTRPTRGSGRRAGARRTSPTRA